MSRFSALSTAVALTALTISISAHAEVQKKNRPVTGQMLGGIHVDAGKTSVAYIEGADFVCSGTLVGSRQILTAAHCIGGEAEDYAVYVGGRTYDVSEIWAHESYDQEGTTDPSNSQYDVGMLILDAPVRNVPAIPIATNSPLFVGQRATLFGFGTNELPYDKQPEIDHKVGRLIIGAIDSGMFETYIEDTGVADCSGDSGGPVIAVVNGFPSVIGVVSTGGSDNLENGKCIPGDGTSQFVDIQTESSINFLANFPEASTQGSGYAFIKAQSKSLEKQVTAAAKLSNLSKMKKQAATLMKKVGTLKVYANNARNSLLDKAVASLKKVSSAKNKSAGSKVLKSAASNLKSIAALK